MGSSAKTALVTTLFFLAFISLISCGGGSSSGGGGGTTPVATSTQTVLSGTVQAPGGAIAFFKQPSLGDLFASEAYAALTGLANVPDNTIVQLARLNATATSFSVISTTTTSGGRYSFNLSSLGIPPANDLIVRVTGPSGREMRAFVVGTVADISPVSEAAYQLAIQSLNGGPIYNLTLQEVGDISGAVVLIAMLQNIGNATSVDQAVELVRSAVGANAQVTGFIASAAGDGQTTQGTGDVGNFFPFDQGNIWRYQGTKSALGAATIGFRNTILISGEAPAPHHGINSTVFTQANDEGTNRAERSYKVKGSSGITFYESDDLGDNISIALAPYQAVHFPLSIGVTSVLVERRGLSWGIDEDGDGVSESFSVIISQTPIAMESLTVSAGTYLNAIKIEEKGQFVVNFTRGGSATLTQINTIWRAPAVGKLLERIEAHVDNQPVFASLSEELVGYVVAGQGSGLRIQVNPHSLSMRVGEQRVLQASALDLSNEQILGLPLAWSSTNPAVATISPDGTVSSGGLGTTTVSASLGNLTSNLIPITVSDVRVISLSTNDLAYDSISGRLYASTPGPQGRILTIDPVTGSTGPSVAVGSDPNKLAISEDGLYLYVSMDDSSAIRRLSLPALTTDLNFSLGALSPSNPQEYICGKDIKVIPGRSQDVVVARARHLGSGSCIFNEPSDIAIFQNGIELPNRFTGPGGAFVHLIEFSDSASTLFGLGTFSPGDLVRLSVTPSGLSLIDFGRLANWPGRDFKYSNGLILTANGSVIAPSTYNELGLFTKNGNPVGGYSLWPDRTSNRVFFVTGGASDLIATINVFQIDTQNFIDSLDIPNLNTPAVPQHPRFTSLVRFGSNGLAFRTSSNEIVIIRSPLVGS